MAKMMRAFAWAFGGCLGLAALLYVVVFLINRKDEAPSKDAIALTELVVVRPQVPDAENAWFANLGLGAPAGSDPLALSVARKRYLETLTPTQAGEPALPGREHDYKRARPAAIAKLADACRRGDAECARLVHGDFAQVEQWLASEHWLLERFERVEALHAWRDVVPHYIDAPLPSVQHMINGQQLVLMQAWQQARAGDGEAARALLDRDFVFWRMVMRSTTWLITKTVAAAAIERNLSVGNLVLRDHALAPPPSWGQLMTREELSMRRVFATEYLYRETVYRNIGRSRDISNGGAITDALLRPTFKPEATSNLVARDIVEMCDRLDVDPGALRAAAESLEGDVANRVRTPRVYNFYGRMLNDPNANFDLIKYALRVADVEGVRRAALLASELRANAQSTPDAVRTSRWKDPYTQSPFAWDAKSASIVFTGLAEGDRKRHAILL